MKNIRWKLAALGAAVIVAACGGGGAEPPSSRAGIKSVKVMGDSLADSGVFLGIPGFGRLFSVENSASEPNTLWTERIAASLGVPTLCNVYKYTGTTFIANPVAGCTSYGVGGGRINNPASDGGTASPVSILKQLQDAGAASNYAATDLLLIDGGGNDAADLVGAYLKAATDGGVAYAALLSSVLPPATVATTLAGGAAGAAQAGGLYMTALADTFFAAIKTNALDKGARQVAVMNMLGITNTPRFQMVLDSIAAASGGGAAGATARAQAEGLFRSWVVAFNQELAGKFAGDSRVTVVDAFTTFDDQVAHPAQYGLTNVKTPACPITGVGADGLPTYTFQTCTAAALSAQTPPAGATGGADWWKGYLFSDGFHPTPYGFELLGQLVSRSLATAGWL